MKFKKRRVSGLRLLEIASKKLGHHHEPPLAAAVRRNEDTAALVKAKLAALHGKDYVVLASYKASSGPDHEVRMSTTNHTVFCTGRCWQYSKDGTCKHLEHFKANVKPIQFGRIEKRAKGAMR